MSRTALSPILLPGNPIGALEAVPKQYADGYLVGKLLAAPTATEDGKVPVWNHGTGQWGYTTPSGGGGSLTLAADYATASYDYIPFTSTLSGSISSAKTGGIYFNPLWNILKTNLFYATSGGNAAFSGSWLGSNAWGIGGDFADNNHKIFIGMVDSAGVRQSAAADLILTVDGQVVTGASTTTRASMNIPAGTAPTTPVTGDLWVNGGNLYFRGTSTTYNLCSAGGGITLSTALTGYTLGSNTALTASDTVLSGFGNLQAQVNAKEDGLGNPSVNGYVLASTTAGVRSWVAMGGGSTNNPTFTGVLTLQGTGTPTTLANAKAYMYDTQNSYLQAVIQNLSSGANASSDLVLMTNTGTDSAEYIDLGINNSAYSGVWGGAKDGYLYVDGGASGVGDLILGTQQANTYVDINVGGGTNRVVRFSPEKAMIITGLTAEPSAPEAGNLTLYAKKVGGRVMPKIKGPSGLDTSLQPNISRNKIAYALPNGNSTTITYLGLALSATGTATAKNVATTNLSTQMRGVEYLVTTASTTAVAGFRSVAAQFWRGNAEGAGGFHYVCRWGPATGVSTATNRSWVGLRNSTSAPTDVEPSSQLSAIGMGWDAADTNIQIMHNDGSGTATKIDLGASFPVPTVDRTKVYELAMFAAPNGSSVDYEVTDLATGATATGTISTDLPTNTTLLAPVGYSSVGGTSSMIGITLYSLYIETDY